MSVPSASKICGICHSDCSRKPRAKDAQGRYYCEECLAQRQAEASLRAGAEPAGPSDRSATSATRTSSQAAPPRLPDLNDDDMPFTGGFEGGPPKDLWQKRPRA